MTDDHDRLAMIIADTVISTPQVARLEPTLGSALARLRGQVSSRVAGVTGRGPGGAAGADGVQIAYSGDTVSVAVDVSVRSARPAVATATDVGQRIKAIITDHGYRSGHIDVTVLSVEL